MKNTKTFLWVATLLFVGVGTIFALNTETTGFRIDNGETKTISVFSYDTAAISAGQSYRIKNTSGKNYFIPTKTVAEWNAFKSNSFSGIDKRLIKTYYNPTKSGYPVLNDDYAAQSALKYCQEQGYSGYISKTQGSSVSGYGYYYFAELGNWVRKYVSSWPINYRMSSVTCSKSL